MDGDAHPEGAAIRAESSTVIIVDAVFQRCSVSANWGTISDFAGSPARGGAISITGGDLRVLQSLFIDNTASTSTTVSSSEISTALGSDYAGVSTLLTGQTMSLSYLSSVAVYDTIIEPFKCGAASLAS